MGTLLRVRVPIAQGSHPTHSGRKLLYSSRALWHTFEDQQHNLTHWVQLLTIANAQQAGPSDEVSKLRKEVADLRKMVSQRSRSPRGKSTSNRSLPAPSQLALPALPTSKGSGKKERLAKVRKPHKV